MVNLEILSMFWEWIGNSVWLGKWIFNGLILDEILELVFESPTVISGVTRHLVTGTVEVRVV